MVEEIVVSVFAGFEQISTKVIELGPSILYLLVVLVIAFFAIKIVKHFVKKFFKKVDFDEDIEHLLTNVTGWILWFIVIIWLVGQLGLDEMFQSLLAVGALGGLAIALAVKDTLKDIVAGIMILQDRHFDINDRVKAAGFEGVVFEVSLRKTRLKLDNGQIVVVPNSKIDNGGWQFISRDGRAAEEFASEKDIDSYIEKERKKLRKLKSKARKLKSKKK